MSLTLRSLSTGLDNGERRSNPVHKSLTLKEFQDQQGLGDLLRNGVSSTRMHSNSNTGSANSGLPISFERAMAKFSQEQRARQETSSSIEAAEAAEASAQQALLLQSLVGKPTSRTMASIPESNTRQCAIDSVDGAIRRQEAQMYSLNKLIAETKLIGAALLSSPRGAARSMKLLHKYEAMKHEAIHSVAQLGELAFEVRSSPSMNPIEQRRGSLDFTSLMQQSVDEKIQLITGVLEPIGLQLQSEQAALLGQARECAIDSVDEAIRKQEAKMYGSAMKQVIRSIAKLGELSFEVHSSPTMVDYQAKIQLITSVDHQLDQKALLGQATKMAIACVEEELGYGAW